MENCETTVIREGLSFGEGPRWHKGRLWFSDFYRRGVFSVAPDGSDERLEHEVPGQPSGLGWTPDGDLLCVSMVDHRVLRIHDGEQSTFCDISEHCGFWANDMVVSETGFVYVGNFGFDFDTLLAEIGIERLLALPPPTTNLVVINPQGDVIQVVPDISFPNGAVITPDGSTLILSETMANRLAAFAINPDGTLSDRRVWAQLDFVACDGICLDANGEVWVANALSNQCLRFQEDGAITGTVTTNQTAFACMLGGDDRRTLYVMTSPTSDRFNTADRTLGKIESTRVATPGAGCP